ncbi:N-acetyllactosaminide beta-1,3-N-acetylglucosaminyltransferase 2 [Sebastes umbrosus]|uniref:N-acetyllactosaminide beta-1,3-N-acetylglucosaminyltransferase 2 n=1 Tax=Sebastes umbrosus TaxID=72105 RepID=UPI00189D82A4|nr:N-acetyllactosaminide beta-1,3-N-acetylglucosaminyltransferase 2 [Sebastes umbrosus]XP_037636282.1 N-acetyllactosaminide beta-1,3-N-acetylglucosaminyltransferase 2 [Sebastes umbrosus]
MARCYCRWRRVLICVCTPCISLALLFVYSFIMLCMDMNRESTPAGPPPNHFVAMGTLRNTGFAPLPKSFWELHGDAIWNRLQLNVDRHFNPILRPDNAATGLENGSFYESLLKQSFSKVTNVDSMKETFEQLPQQIQKFVTHMQRRDYPTLIQPEGGCGAGAKNETESPLLLLAIKSTELNFKNRHAIRQTWGRAGWVAGGGYVRRVFLLAKANTEMLPMGMSDFLQMESEHYGDILQWDFSDTFFNLTLKDVLFWSWFSRSCNRTLFVLKGDDDVFVNTPKLITYLRDQLEKPQAHETIKDFMVGDVIVSAKPSRAKESKYFIPESFYKGHYPVYAGGGGVVYSGLLIKRLHHVSKRVNLFPIDDVYVGMCMVRLNANLVHHPAFLTFDFPKKKKEELCSYHKILLVHKRSPEQVVKLWADVEKTQAECRDVLPRQKGKEKL